jgi:hypothetical protein
MLTNCLYLASNRDPVCDVREEPTEEPLIKGMHDKRRCTQLLQGDCVHVIEERGAWRLVDLPLQQQGHAEGHPRPYRGWVLGESLEKVDRCICALPERLPMQSCGTIVLEALSYIGQPYVWGGLSRRAHGFSKCMTGLDCSGLVYRSFKKAGILLPRDSIDQKSVMRSVSWKELQPADLLFSTGINGRINHVMIWDGEQIIEATDQGASVVRRISFEKKFGIAMRCFQSCSHVQIHFCRCYLGDL